MALPLLPPLLLLLLVAALAPQSGQAAQLLPICLGASDGFVKCVVTNDTASYSGLDVDFFRWVANEAGWKEVTGVFPAAATNWVAPGGAADAATYYYLKCTDIGSPNKIIGILTAGNSMSTCAVGIGSFTITAARSAIVRWSYPYFHTYLGILLPNVYEPPSFNAWAFLKPFDWTIWLAILGTLMVVPVFVWFVENMMQTGSIPMSGDFFHDIRHAIYETCLTVFNLEVLQLMSFPAQLMMITFCFLNLVMVATYTANLAAALTTAQAAALVNSLDDLRGTNVAAHGIYLPRLAKNDFVEGSKWDWTGDDTFMQVTAALQNNTITAYVLDLPMLQYYRNEYDTACKTRILPDLVDPFDYGVAFNTDIKDSQITAFNMAVLAAMSTSLITNLNNQYLASQAGGGKCDMSGNTASGLVFGKVSGLWIILGCVVGFGIVCCFWGVYEHHFKNAGKEEEQEGWAASSKGDDMAVNLDDLEANELHKARDAIQMASHALLLGAEAVNQAIARGLAAPAATSPSIGIGSKKFMGGAKNQSFKSSASGKKSFSEKARALASKVFVKVDESGKPVNGSAKSKEFFSPVKSQKSMSMAHGDRSSVSGRFGGDMSTRGSMSHVSMGRTSTAHTLTSMGGEVPVVSPAHAPAHSLPAPSPSAHPAASASAATLQRDDVRAFHAAPPVSVDDM